jgi:hypothetical protein
MEAFPNFKSSAFFSSFSVCMRTAVFSFLELHIFAAGWRANTLASKQNVLAPGFQ